MFKFVFVLIALIVGASGCCYNCRAPDDIKESLRIINSKMPEYVEAANVAIDTSPPPCPSDQPACDIAKNAVRLKGNGVLMKSALQSVEAWANAGGDDE